MCRTPGDWARSLLLMGAERRWERERPSQREPTGWSAVTLALSPWPHRPVIPMYRLLPAHLCPGALGPGAGLALSQLRPHTLCIPFFHYSVIRFNGSDSPHFHPVSSATSLAVTLGKSLLLSSISASSCKTKVLTLTDRVFMGLIGGWSVRLTCHTAREPEADAHLALLEARAALHAHPAWSAAAWAAGCSGERVTPVLWSCSLWLDGEMVSACL